MKPTDMPPTERVAVTLLKQEGFQKIHWISLLDWLSPYDFIAEKNGIEYCIEVKPLNCRITKKKLQRLKALCKPVIFLLIGTEEYVLISLEGLLKNRSISPFFIRPISENGRLTVPEVVRRALDIHNRVAFCEIETYGTDKAVLRIMSRWSPNRRTPGRDVVKK